MYRQEVLKMQFKLVENYTKAGMLRRDGKYITVQNHPYGTDGPDYTLEFCEWLYTNTEYENTRQDIINFINSYIQEEEVTIEEINDMLLTKFSSNFMNMFKSEVYSKALDYSAEPLLDEYDKKVNFDLNQEFCRVRFGGTYDSTTTKECVFRISSSDYNWLNTIYEFVTNHKAEIEEVTIVRDEESTGEFFYYKYKSEYFNKMPTNEFLTLSGNPYIESVIK